MLATCVAVCLFAEIGQPPTGEAKPAPVIPEVPPKGSPLTVAAVIKSLGLDEAKVRYIEEPSGKLRALHWGKIKLVGTETEVDVEIQLGDPLPFTEMKKVVEIRPGEPLLVTEKRVWNIRRLQDAPVLKVTISPHRKVD